MALIKKTFNILNTSLVLVLASYIANVIFTRLVYLDAYFLAVLMILPLKVYIYSGAFGAMAELASGEELILSFRHFRANARKYWKLYLCVTGIALAAYFLMTRSPVQFIEMDAFSFFAFINPLVFLTLGTLIIRDKYLRPLHLEHRKVPTPLPVLIIMLGLFTIALLVFHWPYFFPIPGFELSRITKFFYTYISYFIYLYFACLLLEQYPEVSSRFEHDREIYLVNPLGGGIAFHLSSVFLRMHPPVFTVIKALTPKTYHFREFNRIFWKKRYYASGKLVAMTCFTSNCIDTYRIAQEYRKRGSTVILGGPHVTYFPDEALNYCDSVVCGEAESVWPQVIKDYENGRLQAKYVGTPVDECYDLIYQQLLDSPPDVIRDFLETSRGCKFKCHFCTVPSLSQGNLRKQRIDQFIELVKKVRKRYPYFIFIDNNIYSDPAYTKELFEALKPLKSKWSTQCSIDIAKNKELLKLAKKSGCTCFLIGFEIPEGSFEKDKGGKLALADHYRQYARAVKKMGIKIKAHYIFGFESDTLGRLWKFWWFCFGINPFATVLSILTPFPGSAFYYDCLEKDRLRNLNWRHYGSQTLVFDHPRMNNAILSRIYPFIFLFFLFTTSKLGYILLTLTIINIMGII